MCKRKPFCQLKYRKPSILLINLMSMMKPSLGANINQLANNLVRQATLKDLIVLADKERCARLVRKTLSFSKKLANPIGLIKYFFCDSNRQLRTLPF
ncbi:Uncharacterized protein PRO82_001508 [Candidatus Protochlamydia amoebophila]|nr:Uncharacterized protein [Candidatus Protochlamydia amoebophila]